MRSEETLPVQSGQSGGVKNEYEPLKIATQQDCEAPTLNPWTAHSFDEMMKRFENQNRKWPHLDKFIESIDKLYPPYNT